MSRKAIKKTQSFTQVLKEATHDNNETTLEPRAVCGPQQENSKTKHETQARVGGTKTKDQQ